MSHRLTDGTRKNQWGGSSKSTGGERQKDGTLRQAKPRPSHNFTTNGQRRANGERRKHGYTLNSVAIANPGNVLKFNVGKGHMGHAIAHENEAPFPEGLPDLFIRSFCPSGGVVLDCFSGSGTTCAAAEKAERRWVGIDIRESEIEKGNRRMADIKGLFA